jgi:hypothetical protein
MTRCDSSSAAPRCHLFPSVVHRRSSAIDPDSNGSACRPVTARRAAAARRCQWRNEHDDRLANRAGELALDRRRRCARVRVILTPSPLCASGSDDAQGPREWPITSHSNPGVMARTLSPWSARLQRNAGFNHYSPNHEARRPPWGQIRQTHRDPGSAEGRCGRDTLPGSPLLVRLRKRNRPAHQLA